MTDEDQKKQQQRLAKISMGIMGFFLASAAIYVLIVYRAFYHPANPPTAQSGFTSAAGHIYEGITLYTITGVKYGKVTSPSAKNAKGEECVEVQVPDDHVLLVMIPRTAKSTSTGNARSTGSQSSANSAE